ncbi:Gfo/Idh/MocA family protein [Streptomyces lasalocidi]
MCRPRRPCTATGPSGRCARASTCWWRSRSASTPPRRVPCARWPWNADWRCGRTSCSCTTRNTPECASWWPHGRLGRLASFSAAFCIPPLPEDDIRYAAELGGGALLDVGVYPLRAAVLQLGPDLDVADATLRTRASDGLDLSGQVLLASPSGVLAELAFGIEHTYASTYTMWGDRARLTVTRAFTPLDHPPAAARHRGAGPRGTADAACGRPTGAAAPGVRERRARGRRCRRTARGLDRHDGTRGRRPYDGPADSGALSGRRDVCPKGNGLPHFRKNTITIRLT